MDVRGITREKDTPLAVPRHDAAVDPERGDPGRVAQLRLRRAARVQQAREVVQSGLRRVALADQPPAPFRQRERRHRAVRPDECVKLVVRQLPGDTNVGEDEGLLVRHAVERHSELVPRRAVRAVAAHEPFGPRGLPRPVATCQRGGHSARILREPDELHLPLDPAAEVGEVLGQKPLGVCLREREGVGIGRVDVVEVHVNDARAIGVRVDAVDLPSRRHEALGDAHPVERLERPRLDAERLRLVRRLRARVDDARLDAAAKELAPHREPYRARPYHQYAFARHDDKP